MLKSLLTICCIALTSAISVSQQPAIEPGQPAELRGVGRIHINAGTDSARNNIIRLITKNLPQLTITNTAEEAEVWLVFSSDQRSFSRGNPSDGLTASATSTSSEAFEIVATGSVIKPVSKDRARRLLAFKDTSATSVAARDLGLSSEFAKAFIKAFRKANQ